MSVLTPAVQDFSSKIAATWRQATDAILETGRLLVEAQEQLGELEFMDLVEDLPFTQSTMSKLLTIGQTKHLLTYKDHLPPHWTTIYELAQMPETQLKNEIETGHIHASTERGTIITLKQSPSTKPPKEKQSVPVLGKIEMSASFDVSQIEAFSAELDVLLKKYGADFQPDTSKNGMFRIRREALANETRQWLLQREKSYNKAKLSPQDLQVLVDTFSQLKRKVDYHRRADGTFDINDIRNPKHPYHGMKIGDLYGYCRENMLVTDQTRIQELDKTAWTKQLLLKHCTGNAAERLDAKRKLERLAARGNDESKTAAADALSMLIEP